MNARNLARAAAALLTERTARVYGAALGCLLTYWAARAIAYLLLLMMGGPF